MELEHRVPTACQARLGRLAQILRVRRHGCGRLHYHFLKDTELAATCLLPSAHSPARNPRGMTGKISWASSEGRAGRDRTA
jgi:hypothetical protein